MDPILLLILGAVAILVIILANGFFVAQEFAYMSVDRVRLAAAAENGDEAARRALAVTRRTSFMLSGAQLGITITSLVVGFIANVLVRPVDHKYHEPATADAALAGTQGAAR